MKSKSAIITFPPRLAIRAAVAFPNPEAPPVTKHTNLDAIAAWKGLRDGVKASRQGTLSQKVQEFIRCGAQRTWVFVYN